MMNQDRVDRITRSYEKHPLTADAILDRVRRQRGEIRELREPDLAIDSETFITDQNHTGGYEGMLSLARALNLQGGEHILDVGAGLGGPVRVLAHHLGCICYGIELTPARFEDCQRLTHLVGLEQLCTFSRGDFLSTDIPEGPFDVILGQDTFMHFPDQQQLIERCKAILGASSWLVIEEGYIREQPKGADSIAKLQQAWNHWNGEFHTIAQWNNTLRSAGFRIELIEDQSAIAMDEYEAQLKKEAPHTEKREIEGWRLGRDLMEEGVIGMIRLCCRKTS